VVGQFIRTLGRNEGPAGLNSSVSRGSIRSGTRPRAIALRFLDAGANFVLPLEHLLELTCTPKRICARKGVARSERCELLAI
jgi:hypothetical protein